MLDPLDSNNIRLLESLRRKRNLAFLVLLIERISLHCWRIVFWALFFAGLWMMELPQFLGNTAEVVFSITFFAGMLFWIRIDILSFRLPVNKILDDRLEQDSKILRGSINALSDTLANPKGQLTRELWNSAQQGILYSLHKLHVNAPKAIIARRDPNALRFIAIIIFICGIFISGPDWQSRIIYGAFPLGTQFQEQLRTNTVTLWIKPPDYTNAAASQILGSGNVEGGLKIQQGSQIKFRVYSPFDHYFAPVLHNGSQTLTMKYIGENMFGAETMIEKSDRLSISQFYLPRANWPYTFVPDNPPYFVQKEKTNNTSKPEKSASNDAPENDNPFEILSNSHMQFTFTVQDDYGVTDLDLSMELDPAIDERPIGSPYHDTKLVMSPADTEFKIDPVYDLTWHNWAGLPVVLNFSIKDHLGQIEKFTPISITLPERKFENPVARSIIAIRKNLAWSKDYDFAKIANDLASLLTAKDFFKNEPAAYLGIKTASVRLLQTEGMKKEARMETSNAVSDLLWDIAIALEDGRLALAHRDVLDAQKALENALRNPNTSEDEIDRLMQDMQDKIQNYFSALQDDIKRRMENGEHFPMLSPDQYGQMINPESLSNFLEQLQSEMKSGNTTKSKEMLSQLQRMMEMMDPSMHRSMPKDMQMMSKGVSELQKLIENQEKLKTQTEKQAKLQDELSIFNNPNMQKDKEFTEPKNGFPPAPKPGSDNLLKEWNKVDTTKNKDEQEALRMILGKLMIEADEKLGEIPEKFGRAERNMVDSSESLGKDNPKESIPHQESAIKNLKDSQEELKKKLKNRMQQMVGIGLNGGMKYDPLGRPYGNHDQQMGADSQVKIPDETQQKRVQEILRLLRERSGEFQRPEEELEYFRRLLRQF